MALKAILSDQFVQSFGTISSPTAFRRALLRRQEVRDLKESLSRSTDIERAIDGAVSKLMADFQKGMQFPHEIELSAIAVALEDHKSKFAEQFLLDLARLSIVEMTLSPQVARICAKYWYKGPRVKSRVVVDCFPVRMWKVRKPLGVAVVNRSPRSLTDATARVFSGCRVKLH